MKIYVQILILCIFSLCAYCELPAQLIPTGWVESKGGYIRTGIYQQNASQVIIDCVVQISSLSYKSTRFMGFYGNGINSYFGIATDNTFSINNKSTIKADANRVYHLRMIQDRQNTALEIYDYKENFENETLLERVENKSNGMGTTECQIFNIKGSSSYICYGMRIQAFKISIDNELKADFIPVFDTLENKPGMYDNVTEQTLFGTGNLVCETQEIFYGSGNTKIFCDKGTMYLPSHVSFDNLNALGFPEGTVLRGAEEASLVVGTDKLDMFTLFGPEMTPGTNYQINVEYPFGARTNFYIAKSSNLSTLYINLDTKDINYIHKSKYNQDTGLAIKIAPNGTASQNLTVKKFAGRGNASFSNSGDKKPYKINLKDKFALIDSSAKNKKFALVALNMDNADHSGLREFIAHELGDSVGMNFTPDIEFVDLYVDGSYRGFYMLKERVTIDPNRININEPKYAIEDEESTTRVIQKNGIKGVNGDEGDSDDHASFKSNWNVPAATETIRSENDDDDPALKAGIQAYQFATNSQIKEGKEGGLVIEMNVNYSSYLRDERTFFITKRGQIFSIKTPEVSTQEQVQRIAIFIQEMEDALFDQHGFNKLGKHYSDYLDVYSMARRFFVDGFLLNYNFCLNSTFFYIDADPNTGEFIGKLISEPIWDYDDYSKFASSHLYFSVGYEMIYITQLFNKADFLKALYDIQTAPNGFVSKATALNTTDLTNLCERLTPAYQLNLLRFGTDSLADAITIESKMKSRTTSWNNIFSQSEKLLGAWITTNINRSTSISLKAEIYGTATKYQWYKLENGSNDLIALEDETEANLNPQLYGKGEYVCGVRGRNLEIQAGETYITLYTAPFNFTLPEPGIFGLLLTLLFIMGRKAH